MSSINYVTFVTTFMPDSILRQKKKISNKQQQSYMYTLVISPHEPSEHYCTRDSMSILSFSNVFAYSDKLSISRVFCKVGTSSSTSGSQRSSPEVVIEEPKELVSSVILKGQHRKSHIIQ